MKRIEGLVEDCDPYILALDVHRDASDLKFFQLRLIISRVLSLSRSKKPSCTDRHVDLPLIHGRTIAACFWGEQLRRMQIIRPFSRSDYVRA